jgi:hypothetical protein
MSEPIKADDFMIDSFLHWVDGADGIIGEDQIPEKYKEYMQTLANKNKSKVTFHALNKADISAIRRKLEERGMLSESTVNEVEERNIILSKEERYLIVDMLNAKTRVMDKGTSRYSPGSGLSARLNMMRRLKEKLL